MFVLQKLEFLNIVLNHIIFIYIRTYFVVHSLTHKQIAVQHRELSLRSAISKSDSAELTNNTAAEKHFLHAEEFLIASYADFRPSVLTVNFFVNIFLSLLYRCGVRFRALGSRHPEYLSSLHNLAELYHAFGYKEQGDHIRDNISSQNTDSAGETPL